MGTVLVMGCPIWTWIFLILILLVATLCLFINLLTLHAETVWPLQVVYTMPLLWG